MAEPETLALSQALADKMIDALAGGMQHEHIAASITNAAALFIAATAHQRPGIAFSAARDISNALPKLVATLVAQAQRDTQGERNDG
jgi:hypothetical protein